MAAVWKDKNDHPGTTNRCWTDNDCPANQQCGYALFAFSPRVDNPGEDRIVTLDHRVSAGVRHQRGACSDSSACSDKKPCATGDCIGYGLQALELVK